ncbi:MAG: hypothetical protein FWD66_11350 [Paludibacter sp.]|nr:hypothetical protein [Paludibacter sp.]
MKNYTILLLGILLFCGCNNKSGTIENKFNTLKDLDYSEFSNMSITNRYGVFYVNYKGELLTVEKSFFKVKNSLLGKMTIEKKNGNDTVIDLTDNDINKIKSAVIFLKKLNIEALEVDLQQNVFLSIPYGYCTYYFLKLSPSSTLESMKKQYYKPYSDNWYLNKECASR